MDGNVCWFLDCYFFLWIGSRKLCYVFKIFQCIFFKGSSCWDNPISKVIIGGGFMREITRQNFCNYLALAEVSDGY